MYRNGEAENYSPTTINNTIQTSIPSGTQLIDIELLDAAPKAWNFYSPLSDFKMETLKESILKRGGIINPIVVWQKQGSYIILSGHNRTAAYKEILQMAKEKGYNEYLNVYNKIPAIIKGEFELDDNEAQQIIIDCNWAQRDLTPMEKNKSIIKKYALVKENSNTISLGEGKTRDKIAEDFNISGRQIQKYMSLSNLIEEWQSILNEGDISLSLALKLVKLSANKQTYLFENHLDTVSIGGTKIEKLIASIKEQTNNQSLDVMFKNLLEEIDNDKKQELEDYSLKVAFKLDKISVYKLKKLSKKEKEDLQKEIENLIKSKYLS